MEEPTKYELQREKISTVEMTKLKEIFQINGRRKCDFITGDILVTVENRLQQVGPDLSEEKARELLESGYVKAFYPSESSIDLK
ncbi:hypothetical protein [Planomicrobium okeanokoites]|uniref:hypothetical protein n=1 Tax=Planomicrobium okeanokoites TaxID=244 RepID=UPI00248F7086|nr:hypothetical protein [Planomicrobium okeanokoites]